MEIEPHPFVDTFFDFFIVDLFVDMSGSCDQDHMVHKA
jgi:hypothetical protein